MAVLLLCYNKKNDLYIGVERKKKVQITLYSPSTHWVFTLILLSRDRVHGKMVEAKYRQA